jgi:hypothetical protein
MSESKRMAIDRVLTFNAIPLPIRDWMQVAHSESLLLTKPVGAHAKPMGSANMLSLNHIM